jgi:hypothetical protein
MSLLQNYIKGAPSRVSSTDVIEMRGGILAFCKWFRYLIIVVRAEIHGRVLGLSCPVYD